MHACRRPRPVSLLCVTLPLLSFRGLAPFQAHAQRLATLSLDDIDDLLAAKTAAMAAAGGAAP